MTNQPSVPAPEPDSDVVAQFADKALLYNLAEEPAAGGIPDTSRYRPDPGEEEPQEAEILLADEIIAQIDGPDDAGQQPAGNA